VVSMTLRYIIAAPIVLVMALGFLLLGRHDHP
jgi:hypothetical protein